MTDSVVVGVFADGKAGIYQPQEERYLLLSFAGVIVATGARERSLVFPGNDLPGVFGAGAFQTLVNRDLVKSSERVLIVGCGNVGLIAAYHALQAGIDVVALIDIAPKVSGYKVHGDKVKRMGVPIYLSHTPVSYTHLDVYKRQISTWASSRPLNIMVALTLSPSPKNLSAALALTLKSCSSIVGRILTSFTS